jgi:hypothetical protein
MVKRVRHHKQAEELKLNNEMMKHRLEVLHLAINVFSPTPNTTADIHVSNSTPRRKLQNVSDVWEEEWEDTY